MLMSVKLDWRHALTVARTHRALSPVSANQDMSWALIAGNATVSDLFLYSLLSTVH